MINAQFKFEGVIENKFFLHCLNLNANLTLMAKDKGISFQIRFQRPVDDQK